MTKFRIDAIWLNSLALLENTKIQNQRHKESSLHQLQNSYDQTGYGRWTNKSYIIWKLNANQRKTKLWNFQHTNNEIWTKFKRKADKKLDQSKGNGKACSDKFSINTQRERGKSNFTKGEGTQKCHKEAQLLQ